MTTYEELYRKVLLRIDTDDGRALLAAKESVNDAHKDIARVWDVDEFIVKDTTSGSTVPDQKIYHIEDDLGLSRPKDILGIVLEDDTSSRRLVYKPPKWMEQNIPYPEGMSTGKSTMYTRHGNNIELIPIPDESYPLHITHSQWPPELTLDSDETEYTDIDDVIIALATERTRAILNDEGGTDWSSRAKYYLGMAVREDRDRPDQILVAQPFKVISHHTVGDYWRNPFIKENP